MNKTHMIKVIKIAVVAVLVLLFLLGTALLTLNAYGTTRTLRIQNNYENQYWLHKNGTILTEKQFYKSIIRGEDESDKEYAIQVNIAVHDGIAHYWSGDLRVPIWENWILFLDGSKKYEYYDYNRAVERGVGLCSQQALIVAGILNQNNIRTKIFGLQGHVVTEVLVDRNNTWWILDPDYGVVVPHSHKETNDNPSIVAEHYRECGYQDDVILQMTKLYGGGTSNLIYNSAALYYGLSDFRHESVSYKLKWVIPILCLLPGILVTGILLCKRIIVK